MFPFKNTDRKLKAVIAKYVEKAEFSLDYTIEFFVSRNNFHIPAFMLPKGKAGAVLAEKNLGGAPPVMASAGARAYQGGLGALPPAGVQRAEPPVGGQGGFAP